MRKKPLDGVLLLKAISQRPLDLVDFIALAIAKKKSWTDGFEYPVPDTLVKGIAQIYEPSAIRALIALEQWFIDHQNNT